MGCAVTGGPHGPQSQVTGVGDHEDEMRLKPGAVTARKREAAGVRLDHGGWRVHRVQGATLTIYRAQQRSQRLLCSRPGEALFLAWPGWVRVMTCG